MGSAKQLDLPCGLEQVGGSVARACEIRKLKGRMQREIAKMHAKKKIPQAKLLNSILLPSIVSIGGESPTLRLVRDMHIGDRDWLLFELRKHTWGDKVDIEHKCEDCGAKVTLPGFDLNKLTLHTIPEDADWWNGTDVVPANRIDSLPEEELKLLRCRCFTLEPDEGDDMEYRGVFRYGNGNDQAALAPVAHLPIDSLFTMMSSTCLFWDDPEHQEGPVRKKRGLPVDFWEDLDMDVLDKVEAQFNDAQPGIDTQVEVECDECGHEDKIRINIANFFFPEARKRS